MSQPRTVSSPRWGAMTKLVVALTFVAALAWVFARFQSILAPLLMAFILSYLLYPLAHLLNRKLYISWRTSVSIIYVLLVIILLGMLTVGGLGLIQQIQSLIKLIQKSLTELPSLIVSIADWINTKSPIPVDLNTFDLTAFSDQLIAFVQPLLGQTGQLLGALASGAVQVFGWTAFVLLVSYFVLTESGGFREGIIKINVPGYNEDLTHLSHGLGRIWNAFLRGQIIIFFMTVIVYTILLTALGIRYAIGLAFLAGLARFLPYVGPAINWGILVLVAFFQDFKLFGMQPLAYTLLVVALALIIDQIFDNLISPRIMANALKVHPAGVLVMAIVAANLLGILGVVIAAPFLATLQLGGQYVVRKMFDQDPWPAAELEPEAPPPMSLPARLRQTFNLLLRKLRNLPIGTASTNLPAEHSPKGEDHEQQ